jgi:asparagine synthase (glutamine-hydrolysing)
MCGIAGQLNLDGAPVELSVLDEMLARLAHRGPDDSGHFVDGSFGFGNRRLSIIDLAGGHQPMANDDRTVWVVQNGEIYNFPELRQLLASRGHKLRTTSDTEVIVGMYEHFGVDGLTQLRGMFAVAVWDVLRRRLVLARDHVGVKPLYYYLDGSRLVFASEIRSLLACPAVPRRMSLPAMDRYLSFAYVPGSETIFEGIRRLPPAHLLIAESGRVDIRRYWEPDVTPRRGLGEAEAAEELRARLRSSVGRHMLADVPVGVFLSGGLDSSAIVAMLAAMGRTDTPTFSVGFTRGARYFDESEDARAVAEHFGLSHQTLVVEPDVRGLLGLVESLEEPMGGATTFLTYLISRAAREHVKVALSGTGGDELFGGYRRYMGAVVAQHLHRVPAALRAGLRGGMARLHLTDDTRLGYHLNTLRRLVEAAESVHPDAYIGMLSYFTPAMKRSLYADDVAATLAAHDPLADFRGHFERPASADLLGRTFYLDLMTYLPDNLLLFTDKMSMAVSLEVRVPLLDLELVEFAAGLPGSFRVHGTQLKYLLRKAMAPVLPPRVLRKSKQGFSAPVGEWLRRELRGAVDDVLGFRSLERRGLFKPRYVTELVSAHQTGVRESTHQLFTLMLLELWCRHFLDAPRPAAGGERLVELPLAGASGDAVRRRLCA